MKNTFGQSVSITLFGESHGDAVGAVLDGIAPGIYVDEDYIALELDRRRGNESISTGRREADRVKIVSGVKDSYTTGTPICAIIENTDVDSSGYAADDGLLRPGHADYTGYCKYHGFEDKRGGGHFSGRLTAPITALGAICRSALADKGILIASHVMLCGGVCDREFDFEDFESDVYMLDSEEFPALDEDAAEKMTEAILAAKEAGDSLGGVVETVISGLPRGVGEPWFDSIEGVISHAMFSIPAIKGVEFGDGFAVSGMTGSEANDSLQMLDGEVSTVDGSNHAGGVLGGISNGMPIVFRCAVKPTPSIAVEQDTVNINTLENEKISVRGRHDPCIAPRAVPVIDNLTAIVVCDMLAGRFGTDFLRS